MLIFAFCFIGIFALLLGTMDSRFLAVQSLNSQYQTDKEAAAYFEMANLTAQTYTQFYLLYGPGNSRFEQFNLPPGHAIEFWWDLETRFYMSIPILELRHVWPGFLGLYNNSELLSVIYPYSTNVTVPEWGLLREYGAVFPGRDDLLALWENRVENASYCEWQRGGYSTKTFIAPHNTTRTITESWLDGNLSLTVGFSYDWNQTNINAFDLLGQILFFQAPSLGLTGVTNTILNAFIAIPLWIMIIIISLKLIQSVIPFIKGTEN